MDLRDLERAGPDPRLTGTLPATLAGTAGGRPPTLVQRVLFYVCLAHLGAMSLTWNLLLGPLVVLVLGRRDDGRVGRASVSWIYRSFWKLAHRFGLMRIDSTTLDRLRHEGGGLVIAANHPAMYDALVIAARLPRAVCVMKADLLKNPFVGAGARLARYITNDSDRGIIRESVATLRAGNQLVLFPEGTRTVSAPVNAFKPGVTLIAQLADVPIQTVFIETRSPYLTKGWPLLSVPPLPVEVRVSLGERFEPDADHRAALVRLEAYFRRELAR